MHFTRYASALVLLGASVASAQNPAGQPPPQGRGGGRGRAVQVMTLSSAAFPDGREIPLKHSQAGKEISPPLSWTGTPDSVASFVLLVHDPNAASGNGIDDVLHWLVWNIPKTATSLPEGVPAVAELPDGTRQISATGPYFRGPAAASSGPPHHYVFELFAIDTTLDIPAVGASPAATRTAILAAMAGHVRGKAVTVGLFKRPPS
jgi:Raf kinase inhibitor-like YbhB/YbcL family protein